MALGRDDIVRRLVVDVVGMAEKSIDNALSKVTQFTDPTTETIAISIPMIINQPKVIELLKNKYLSVGWKFVEFKTHIARDQRDDDYTTVTFR